MKTLDVGKLVCQQDLSHRRLFFKFAASSMGLAMLPRWALSAAAPAVALSTRLGYLGSDGSLVDVSQNIAALPGQSGQFQLRLHSAASKFPFALEAQYTSEARHRFWMAWRQQDTIQMSPAMKIRWLAAHGESLLVVVRSAGKEVLVDVPARAGTYTLAISNSSRVPELSGLVVREVKAEQKKAELVSRTGAAQVDFAYVIFSIEAVPV